ncbi:MAG: hypothetical protein KAT40_07860 [Bacteroidales bacterium]|nr:hypothetical protein [Bacteroidales bacterium]
MKCDTCPACPVRKNDCIGVKFEERKYFNIEGAYFTMVKSYKLTMVSWNPLLSALCSSYCITFFTLPNLPSFHNSNLPFSILSL